MVGLSQLLDPLCLIEPPVPLELDTLHDQLRDPLLPHLEGSVVGVRNGYARDQCHQGGMGRSLKILPRFALGRVEGALRNLFSDGYGSLLQAINTAGHAPSGESREVYHRWQGPDAGDNQIEIQFGLQ
jgi:hypothetical protein